MMAFFLIFLGVMAWQYLTPKPPPPPQKQEAPQPAQSQSSSPAAPAVTAPRVDKGKHPAAVVPSTPLVPVKKAEGELETVIETKLYRITFTNRGGQVKSWVLKKEGHYLPDADVELVNPITAPVMGYPLSFFTYDKDKDLQKKLNEALYVPSATGPQKPPFSLSFEYSDGETLAKKKFTFDESYVISVETEVTSKGQKTQAYPEWPSGFGDDSKMLSSYAGEKLLWQQNKDIQRQAAQSGWFLTGKKSISNGATLNGPFQWAATADQYFTAAFMPYFPEDTALVTLHNQVEIAKDPEKPNEDKMKVSVLGLAVGSVRGSTRERLFVGPKSVDLLESATTPSSTDLRGILDYGMFGFISRPLFACLTWTYDHIVRNWGWAIAILTLVINLLLLPLRIQSIKSALKMQKIQPQIKVINEKYKRYTFKDTQRMAEKQKETQALMKSEGVNQLGGCFPMLLQMPFLFAFYSMLSNAFELRHANWLWVHDLSAADPWHVLPIIVVITMFLTQQSTPAGGMDPAQAKMMKYMTPIMIGGMTWVLPAGLGVYWAISNIIGYIQQTAVNRSAFGQQVRKTVEKRAKRKK